MDVQPDTSSGLADHGTVLEGIIDTLDGIVLHADQEAGAQLRVRSASIEEGGRCMCKIALGHEIVSVENAFNIRSVYADSNTHEHVLRSFGRDAINLQ
jgi:hypothetical protein